MKLVTLATFPSEFEATLAKNALDEKGIKAAFAGGTEVIAPPSISLVVEEKDLQPAGEILKEAWEYGSLHAGHEWAEEEKIGDRAYRVNPIAILIMAEFIMMSVLLSSLFSNC